MQISNRVVQTEAIEIMELKYSPDMTEKLARARLNLFGGRFYGALYFASMYFFSQSRSPLWAIIAVVSGVVCRIAYQTYTQIILTLGGYREIKRK